MIRGAFDEAGELDPGELRVAYDDTVAAAIETVGVSTAAEETGVDEATIRDVVDRETPELTLEEAATLLALDPEWPDAESIFAEAQDILLMGMSSAVLDVESLSSGIDGAMDPKVIQQKIEGRHEITLDEYALLHAYIEARKP